MPVVPWPVRVPAGGHICSPEFAEATVCEEARKFNFKTSWKKAFSSKREIKEKLWQEIKAVYD